MDVVTTRSKPKAFSWSYSRLKNYEACPKKHYHCDIKKDVPQEKSDELEWGNLVHKAIAERLGPKKTPLPSGYPFEEWCQKIEASPGEIIVEQQLAINANFSPVEWFAKDAWFRAIADVIKINGQVALLGDWKTGKIVEDSVQLALGAATVFAHYPQIMSIRSEFFWLKEEARTSAVVHRHALADMWKGVWPRIMQLQLAYDNTDFPPKPGFLCRKWCPVKSCPHNGV